MSRSRLLSMAFATLVAAGCSSGGLEYWLYPEPRLAEEEEALFVAHEGHRVLSIDGGEVASRCTGEAVRPQAYARTATNVCRFHIQPGQHTVLFYSSTTGRERMTLDFAAEAGKVYGLTWSGCTATMQMDRHRQSCKIAVVEVERPVGDG